MTAATGRGACRTPAGGRGWRSVSGCRTAPTPGASGRWRRRWPAPSRWRRRSTAIPTRRSGARRTAGPRGRRTARRRAGRRRRGVIGAPSSQLLVVAPDGSLGELVGDVGDGEARRRRAAPGAGRARGPATPAPAPARRAGCARTCRSRRRAGTRPGPTDPMVCCSIRRLMSSHPGIWIAVTCCTVRSTASGCRTNSWISAMNRFGKTMTCGDPSMRISSAASP